MVCVVLWMMLMSGAAQKEKAKKKKRADGNSAMIAWDLLTWHDVCSSPPVIHAFPRTRARASTGSGDGL